MEEFSNLPNQYMMGDVDPYLIAHIKNYMKLKKYLYFDICRQFNDDNVIILT